MSKKLIALWMVLCLLGALGASALAEEEKQTIATSIADFDVPASYPYEIQEQNEKFIRILITPAEKYSLLLTLSTEKGWYSTQMEYFEEWSGLKEEFKGLSQVKTAELTDWHMPDHDSVIAIYSEKGGKHGFTHDYDWAVAKAVLTCPSGVKHTAAAELVKPILRSLRTPGAEAPDDAVPQSATQILQLGRATFEVDSDLAVSQYGEITWLLNNSRYNVLLTYCDWEGAGINIDVTNGDSLVDSSFCLYLLFDNQESALRYVNSVSYADIGMPGSSNILLLSNNNSVTCSYYYPNMGFMLMVNPNIETMKAKELQEICNQIALSFRVDGLSPEEMTAYVKKVNAEMIAAAYTGQDAVITNSNANIRSGPGAGFGRIASGKQGDRFPLLGEENGWYKIDVNGQIGYVSKALCQVRPSK